MFAKNIFGDEGAHVHRGLGVFGDGELAVLEEDGVATRKGIRTELQRVIGEEVTAVVFGREAVDLVWLDSRRPNHKIGGDDALCFKGETPLLCGRHGGLLLDQNIEISKQALTSSDGGG